MAQWAVVASKIELITHPTADSLLIGKVGPFQVVVNKANNYNNGDVIVFAPERSVLPPEMRGFYVNSETGISYLSGPDQDRVKAIKLRGEVSEGVTIPLDYVKDKFPDGVPLDTDLSEVLGITKYEPPLPSQLRGQVEFVDYRVNFEKHDVEQFRINAREFIEGEEVVAYEKIHGSQINIYKGVDGQIDITSKGMASGGRKLKESVTNAYWKAAHNSGVIALLGNMKAAPVQIFGEVIPVQKGYSYGKTDISMLIYRVQIEGIFFDKEDLPNEELIRQLWVPEVYKGPYDADKLVALANRREGVSGKELHIAEGIVVSPRKMRRVRGGWPLYLKILNPKYKSSDDDFS